MSKTDSQANMMSSVITMGMTMLGGTFFTIEAGTALYVLSRFSINTYANDAFRAIISRGQTLADVGPELWLIAGVTAAALVVSRFFFRVTEGN
jgi:ABC-type multidrug transport system permease subunit